MLSLTAPYRLVNVLSKITTSHTSPHNSKDHDIHPASTGSTSSHHHLHAKSVVIPPPLTTDTIQSSNKHAQAGAALPESALKFKSLECLVAVLRSLVSWYANGSVSVSAESKLEDDQSSSNTPRDSEDNRASSERLTSHSNGSISRLSSALPNGNANTSSTPPLDDPEQFENLKHRKQMLQEGIRQFNWKPKKGLQILARNRFVDLNDYQNVARFLLNTEGLSKAALGEFLGEGDPENIAIMHAFVDELDFSNMQFVEALRSFLQTFRLPGEGQKIDRFMLKFAERYVHYNPDVFANAGKVCLPRLIYFANLGLRYFHQIPHIR